MRINNNIIFGIMAISIIGFSCGKKKDDNKDSKDESIGKLEGLTGEDGESGITTLSNNIDTVEEGMIPGALAVSTGLLDSNPCENAQGFIDCQRFLVKLYMAIARQVVGVTGSTILNLKDVIDQFEIGEKQEFIPEDGDGIAKIKYNFPDKNGFSIILHSDAGPFLYLDIDLSSETHIYKLSMDLALAPGDEDDDESGGFLETVITYVDAETFSADVKLVGQECTSDDVEAPQNIAINVNVAAGVWVGKAMTYHPRWFGELSCSDPTTAFSNMYMYTDFTGSASDVTASIYVLKKTTAIADLDDWEISDICTSAFSDACQDEKFGNDSVAASSFQNPVCFETNDSNWGGACNGFPVSGYSAASNWIKPSVFAEYEVELPTSL